MKNQIFNYDLPEELIANANQTEISQTDAN